MNPYSDPYLWALLNSYSDLLVLAIGCGVGLASMLGTTRLVRGWNLMPMLHWSTLVAIVTTIGVVVGTNIPWEAVGLYPQRTLLVSHPMHTFVYFITCFCSNLLPGCTGLGLRSCDDGTSHSATCAGLGRRFGTASVRAAANCLYQRKFGREIVRDYSHCLHRSCHHSIAAACSD